MTQSIPGITKIGIVMLTKSLLGLLLDNAKIPAGLAKPASIEIDSAGAISLDIEEKLDNGVAVKTAALSFSSPTEYFIPLRSPFLLHFADGSLKLLGSADILTYSVEKKTSSGEPGGSAKATQHKVTISAYELLFDMD